MSPLFLIDESLSPFLSLLLKRLGYSAKSVREINMKGSEDDKIVEWALNNNAVIITGDLDFGELWYWRFRGKVGIIVLRLKIYDQKSQFEILKLLHGGNILMQDRIKNSLVIANNKKFRIRSV